MNENLCVTHLSQRRHWALTIVRYKSRDENKGRYPRKMKCPRCQCEALHRYGFSEGGKQRYRCQSCQYQFVERPSRAVMVEKPSCPLCGAMMRIHHRTNNRTAYRCSQYPQCRGYISVLDGERQKES